MTDTKTIGVVGGVGPYAGIDLVKKIFDNTKANTDQENLPVALISIPEKIHDRTEFLLDETKPNPAKQIFEIIKQLESIGAIVVGIPCNTVHSPKIFDVIKNKLSESKSKVKLINMIKEVTNHIQKKCPETKQIGLLSTIGTYKSKVYSKTFEPNGIEVITPDENIKELVHEAIYNLEYGIKAQSHPVTEIAKNKLMTAIKELQTKGAKVIILGCTELPLAFNKKEKKELNLIDSTNILARALIRETYPERLI